MSDIKAVILGKKGLPKNNEALRLTGSKGHCQDCITGALGA
jgi:hypothetical protein